MSPYLLLTALLSGAVGLQTVNSTAGSYEEEMRGPKEGVVLLSNQTYNLSSHDNGVMQPGNMTGLHNDVVSELEKELSNPDAVNITTEDDESFQNQMMANSSMHCNEANLLYNSFLCSEPFSEEMALISEDQWCNITHIIRLYSDMTKCMELLCTFTHCYYPNPIVEEFFLHIHSNYFHNCTEEQLLFTDAPHSVVVILTLIPVSLIPILVFLVVWKSNVQD